MPKAADGTVLVTGASGFLASWIVKSLLDDGYKVRGTVRSTKDPKKVKHLMDLPGAAERLELFEAELLTEGAFDAAASGCTGVFHCASPFIVGTVEDPDAQLLKPAEHGTLNVLRSASKAGTVKRVVVTSSTAACGMTRDMGPGYVFSGKDWGDAEKLREYKAWYPVSKILAERAAWDFVKDGKQSFDVATVCPTLIVGPLLQPVVNTSSELVLQYLDGSKDTYPNDSMSFVDVRDSAKAHVLAYEAVKGDRYLCIATSVPWKDFLDLLRGICPDAKIPSTCPKKNPDDPDPKPTPFSCKELEDLGLTFRGLEEQLKDMVASMKEKGFL
mmetsp:Transcript_8939/g.20849  ORF Transcript_8939/g.20849 Transcript_8939/m.20849 type:complete len:329 (+) Transcript_8939:42-1028(+)